ncbi:hypothetical protein J0J29_23265, partial [Vibrio vulnificus]|uniref:hypothetical protein n=1 Tax=Vibrio vulnificus TaxID=672 RepID=UPI0019D489CD
MTLNTFPHAVGIDGLQSSSYYYPSRLQRQFGQWQGIPSSHDILVYSIPVSNFLIQGFSNHWARRGIAFNISEPETLLTTPSYKEWVHMHHQILDTAERSRLTEAIKNRHRPK